MYVYICVSMCMYMYTSNIYGMYIYISIYLYSIKFHSPNQAAKVAGPSEDIGPQCYLPPSGNANIDAMDGEK